MTAPGRPGRRRLVVAVVGVILLLCIGGAWALASPLGSSPDEQFHLGSIWCSTTAGSSGCVRTGVSAGTGLEQATVPFELAKQSSACYAFKPETSAACQIERPDALVSTASQANDGLYPGGFYELMGLLVSSNVTGSVLAMRLLSWVLCVGMLAAAAAVSMTGARRALVLAVLATSVPMSVYLFASVNPSGMSIAAIGALWAAASTYMTPTVQGRRLVWSGVLAGVVTLVALTTRSDVGVFAVLTVGAVWLLNRGHRNLRNRRALLLAAIALSGLIGVALGSGTGDVAAGLISHPDRGFGDVLSFDLVHLPQIMLGGLGLANLGWADTALPEVVWVPMLMAATSLVTIGLRRAESLRAWCVGLLLVALGALPLYVLLAGRNYVGEIVQARYFLPLLAVIVGTALLPDRGRRAPVFGRTHMIVIAAAISLANSIALHANIRRYVTGTDVRGFDLDHGREWWWPRAPSPTVVWLVGTVAFAAVCTWLMLTFGATRAVGGPDLQCGELRSTGSADPVALPDGETVSDRSALPSTI
ncbi:MAG: DUF2142 domain-containing protein [Ilumatobacteraceae bacterium]